MKRSGYTGGELVVVLGGFVLLSMSTAKGFLPDATNSDSIFGRARENARRAACQSNLKQLSLGLIAYVQDYDEKYPLSSGNGVAHDAGFGWAGSTQPYLKSTQILHCPSRHDPPAPDPSYSDYTDYWYNHRVSNQSQASLNYVSNTFLLGDGNDGHDITDARYSKSELPADWYTDTGKPTFRHLQGANYAFCDGHVKWMVPQIVTTVAASSSVFTFGT